MENKNFNGHEYVDLGLPSGTLWAKYPVGMKNYNDSPLYFAWGETIGYTKEQIDNKERTFEAENYKFGPYENNPTKYNQTDELTTLELEDDAAHVNMGGDWHMPTKEQFEELINYTTYQEGECDGINGSFLISPNNQKIFFPNLCFYTNQCPTEKSVDKIGGFWISDINEKNTKNAWYCYHGVFAFFYGDAFKRYYGLQVHGVINNKQQFISTLENKTQIHFTSDGKLIKINGELPKPVFENEYYSFFKEDVNNTLDKIGVSIISKTNEGVNYWHHLWNKDFLTLEDGTLFDFETTLSNQLFVLTKFGIFTIFNHSENHPFKEIQSIDEFRKSYPNVKSIKDIDETFVRKLSDGFHVRFIKFLGVDDKDYQKKLS